MIVGYTTGVYDLFHIGHLNLLRNAKSMCDKLIVGITIDELVGYKNKKAVIPFHERMEIVRNIRFVDAVIPQENMDKLAMHDKLKFDIMFVGDDWFATPKWQKIDEEFAKRGVRIVYFPYTQGTSSTLLNNVLLSLRQEAEQNQ
ncbi:adenylyltransferase/cytidyltransferase family protein [Helicobacter typhlonius]|uniref:adenylyltransferase/cytidyltransferase family protein n=1 Tax=Helicobacter typhlonius TaxID=76936 RepID=UPI002FDF18C9